MATNKTTDTHEQRGQAYRALADITKDERDQLRGYLSGPGQGDPTITIGGVELDANAARTVLNGNRNERYLAVFPNYWGHGATIAEAVANARKVGARGRNYFVSEHDLATYGAHVDSMGSTRFYWALDSDRSKRPVRVVTSGTAKAKR